MDFLTNDKLLIVGAAGMIGSNMAQTALMMRLTPNICLYDPYAPALEGVAEELYQCAFEGVNLTYTSDVKEAFTGAKYIVSSGGAARKAGMTREDLLKGNAAIAEEFGKNVKEYCPDAKFVVVIFNPADITGLITLIYSGLKPSQVATLAALDSTRLQDQLVKWFSSPPPRSRIAAHTADTASRWPFSHPRLSSTANPSTPSSAPRLFPKPTGLPSSRTLSRAESTSSTFVDALLSKAPLTSPSRQSPLLWVASPSVGL